MLPGIPPTGKRVELAHVVVMKFKDGKISHEHIYWDQASLLVQVGLLDPKQLPVRGVEQARRLIQKAKATASSDGS
jgi:carboxymethylenebutenolidase